MTFFDLRLSFARNEVLPKMSRRYKGPKISKKILLAILIEKVILNTFSRVTFFDLRLSFARNEVLPKMRTRLRLSVWPLHREVANFKSL